MDTTPNPRLLADVDQILTDAHNQITEEARDASAASIAQFFRTTPRQARIILAATNQSLSTAAELAGLDTADFLTRLSDVARIATLAFTAGAVTQHDVDHNLDPATGEPRPA